MKTYRCLSVVLIVLVFLLALSFNVFAAPNTLKEPERKALEVKEIAKQNVSVVLINVYDENSKLLSTGSGFIVSPEGKIVTNFHVVEGGCSADIITSDNKIYPVAGIVNYSQNRDIAVLRILSPVPQKCIVLGDSSKIALGESVVAIGSPLGLQNTVSTGIVSSIRNNLFRNVTASTDIQISAPISHGSSGGALFNVYGEAIGVTYAGLQSAGGENLNFAIPINEVKEFIAPMNYISLSLIQTKAKKDETNDVYKLKEYTKILNEYKRLEDLGDFITNFAHDLSSSSTSIMPNGNTKYLDDSCDRLNITIEDKNSEQAFVSQSISSAGLVGIDTTDMNTILDYYYDSLEDYKMAVDNLYEFARNFSKRNFDKYLDYNSGGFDKSHDGKKLAREGYNYMYNLILSLQPN